jgi:hypothetical protein
VTEQREARWVRRLVAVVAAVTQITRELGTHPARGADLPVYGGIRGAYTVPG